MYQLQPQEGYSSMEKQIIENVRSNKKRQTSDIKKEQEKIIDQVIQGCLHFIQDEFGSAFCINQEGLILTCAHCVVSEDVQHLKYKNIIKKLPFFYLIFANGEIVKAQVQKFDLKLDCALLQIVERDNYNKYNKNKNDNKQQYNFVNISQQNILPNKGEDIFCIGQPGYEDLETDKNDQETGYSPFFVSGGVIKGYLKNDQINCCEKSELGPLKHDCWTYWGHSGAPIFNQHGMVVGMHNSWNDKNCMRHGMSLFSLQKFMKN